MAHEEAFKTAYKSIDIGPESGDQHIPLSEARANFPSLVTEAAEHGKRSVITRFNKPAAAIIPIYDLVRLLEIDEQARNSLQISEIEPGDEVETIVPRIQNDGSAARSNPEVEKHAVETLAKISHIIQQSKVLESSDPLETHDDAVNVDRKQRKDELQPSSKLERGIRTPAV